LCHREIIATLSGLAVLVHFGLDDEPLLFLCLVDGDGAGERCFAKSGDRSRRPTRLAAAAENPVDVRVDLPASRPATAPKATCAGQDAGCFFQDVEQSGRFCSPQPQEPRTAPFQLAERRHHGLRLLRAANLGSQAVELLLLVLKLYPHGRNGKRQRCRRQRERDSLHPAILVGCSLFAE
jgi:hypothetical protein